MCKRRNIRKLDPEWVSHRVETQFHFRGLERPWQVMDVCVAHPALLVHRVKTITVSEPPVERFRSGTIDFSRGFVRRVKFRAGASLVDAYAAIVNGSPFYLPSYSGIIVVKAI